MESEVGPRQALPPPEKIGVQRAPRRALSKPAIFSGGGRAWSRPGALSRDQCAPAKPPNMETHGVKFPAGVLTAPLET